MAEKNPKHVCLYLECGICGRALMPGASFVSLIASGASLGTVPCLDNVVLPYGANNLSVRDWLFCWVLNCRRCALAPEGVATHSDCYKLFMGDCKAENVLDLLLITAVSRRPWRGVRHPILNSDTNIVVELVYEKAEKLGIPRLRLLPPELIQAIRDHADSGTFWRYISVLSLSREISAASFSSSMSSPTLAVPLCSIATWIRGRAPSLLQSSDHTPFMRLAIDSRGIKQIERLPSKPSYQQWRTDNIAYAIQEESELQNVTARFKYNVLRLELPENIRGLHIWDMPNPPSVEDCVFCGHVPQSTKFRTIDLRGVTGLTFFVSFGRVNAIHAHTPTMPYATSTFEYLTSRRRKNMYWLYLPIPKGDEIIALGVRVTKLGERLGTQKPRFLVRTRLAGDIVLGAARQGQYQDIMLGQSKPRLFIYNMTDGGLTTVFGTYTPQRGEGSSVLQSPSQQPNDVAPYQSSVPLTKVTRIRVFNDKESGFCRALIFDYENGAQRAVGDCRLGSDLVTSYLKPARICHRSIVCLTPHPSSPKRPFWVESGCDFRHHHDENGWVCSAMAGSLEFIADPERHHYRIEFV